MLNGNNANMKELKITIIMPVYKAEATIHKSLDSIIAQTLTDWELVIVDDGSPDACGRICDEYAAKDIRLHVIHQKNRGVAAARQVGIEMARGEYIIHVDADDWVEPTMLEEMYNKAKETNADVVICDFFNNSYKGEHYVKQEPSDLSPSNVLNEMFQGLHGSLCNKLMRRYCYTLYNLHFFENINYCEDVLLWAQLLRNEEVKLTYLPCAFYHYVQHSESITNQYSLDTFKAHKYFISALSQLLSPNSTPVIKSKQLAKKLTFLNSILSDKEFDMLYPEIKSAPHEYLLMRIMFRLAFTGHHFPAKLLRSFYRIIH